MSWKNNLRPASFRGVSFWVDGHEMAGGRRTVTHQYPFRDEPFTEDLGRSAKGFGVKAYIAASIRDPDYMPARDALIQALDEFGPGELIHPYLGSIRVQCTTYIEGEEKDRGGIAFFQLSFVEAGQSQYPESLANKPSRLVSTAANARSAAITSALNSYQVAGIPDFVANIMQGMFSDLGSTAGKVAAMCPGTGKTGGIAAAVSLFLSIVQDSACDEEGSVAAIVDLVETIAQTFEEPYEDYRQYDGTYRKTGAALSGPLEEEAVSALLTLARFGETIPVVEGETPMRQLARENRAAVVSLVAITALTEAARLAPFVNWRTFDAAMDARDRLMSSLDAAALNADDDTLYRCLCDLRVLVAETVPSENSRLPSIVIKTTNRTTPSLRLAYDEYDDAYKCDEIVAMNGLRHPGFVPGGQELRVLAYA